METFNFVDLCLQIVYLKYIGINRIWYEITYNSWYAIKPKPNQTNQSQQNLIYRHDIKKKKKKKKNVNIIFLTMSK